MPASNSSGSNELAESMSSLGHDEQAVDTIAVDRPASLGRTDGHISQRLEAVLSQCQTDKEIDRDVWDDFEIHRRSAGIYLNQYLDCWQQVSETRYRHVYKTDDSDHETPPMGMVLQARDTTANDPTREEWRLKISRDSFARDLLAMDETLEFLKTRVRPPPRKEVFPMPALLIPSGILGYILWQNSYHGKAMIIFVASAFVASTAGIASRQWTIVYCWIKNQTIKHNQKKIKELLKLLNEGELNEGNRESLRGVSFYLLDRFRKMYS